MSSALLQDMKTLLDVTFSLWRFTLHECICVGYIQVRDSLQDYNNSLRDCVLQERKAPVSEQGEIPSPAAAVADPQL